MADFVDSPVAAAEAPAQEVAKVVKAMKTVAAATKGKKKVTIAAKNKTDKPTYAAMVTKAILELKEKKGSSRQSIMKYLQGNYKVEAASATLLMNKALKKMTTDGRLVAGAQAGKSGAGCYKVSVEEKTKIKQVEGLRLMERQSINVYMWLGRMALKSTLMMLKQMAEKEDMMGQLSMVRIFINQDSAGELQRVLNAKESSVLKYNLVMMSQKLMMMFLTLPQSMPLLILEASIIIHGPVLTIAKRKSSMQRLGDIAKIIASLGLVAKAMKKKGDSKKNISYHYVGQEVPHLLSVLSSQCEDVEMVEDLAAVRDIVQGGEENV